MNIPVLRSKPRGREETWSPSLFLSRRKFAKIFAAILSLRLDLGKAIGQEGLLYGPPLVFAHYVMCCPRAGAQATSADLATELTLAKDNLIDGFSLNCGAWSTEKSYPRLAAAMFDAATSVSGFKLFFSADTTGNLSIDDICAMMLQYYDHPNYFRVQGIPVLSCYSNGDEWAHIVVERLKSLAKPVFFIPYFYFGSEPSESRVSEIVTRSRWADGFFYFGAAGLPERITNVIRLFARELRAYNKPFMASATPYYRGVKQNYRVFESKGFEAMAAEWVAAIEAKANWMQVVTWNDWAESSYVAPFGSKNGDVVWYSPWGPLLPHQAYLQASRHYILWFKSGHAPPIEKDEIFYFYRLHPKQPTDSPAGRRYSDRLAPPAGGEFLVDRIFLTLFLRDEARLYVWSGESHFEMDVSGGIQHVQVPFAVGVQRFALMRHGEALFEHTAALPITNDTWSKFNYFSGRVTT